jgi:hypothetical protein
MKPNRSMTVARRLTLGVSLLIVMTLAVAGLGGWGMWQSQSALQTVYEDRTVPLEQLGDINYLVARNRVLLMAAVLEAKPESL